MCAVPINFSVLCKCGSRFDFNFWINFLFQNSVSRWKSNLLRCEHFTRMCFTTGIYSNCHCFLSSCLDDDVGLIGLNHLLPFCITTQLYFTPQSLAVKKLRMGLEGQKQSFLFSRNNMPICYTTKMFQKENNSEIFSFKWTLKSFQFHQNRVTLLLLHKQIQFFAHLSSNRQTADIKAQVKT